MSEDKIKVTKKIRRQWLFDAETNNIVTIETAFDLNLVTPEGKLFLQLYGFKQYEADIISAMGGTEFSDAERADKMNERYDDLCDKKFKIVHTEAGFYFKDPDAVAAKRGGIKQSALYDYFIEQGHSHEEATAAINKIKS